jgi:hypothetical protein
MYTQLHNMQKAEDSLRKARAIALLLVDETVRQRDEIGREQGIETDADQPLYAAIEAMLSAREALQGAGKPDRVRGDDVAA